MSLPSLYLKKNEARRIRNGHCWIYSNEIDTHKSPLKSFAQGEEVEVLAHDETTLGLAYINPHSLIAARMFSRDITKRLDHSLILSRLQNALSLRERLFNKPFYRLAFSEGDDLPGVVIDRFDEHLIMQVNTCGMELKTAIIADALLQLLPNTRSILLRNDSAVRTQEDLELLVKPFFGEVPSKITMEENDTCFIVPLLQGQKTGWFYDHRVSRARFSFYSKGMEVLDVFSYLGSFGIQAARYGAAQVDCVEASAFASDYIKRNAALNNVDARVNVITEDAFDALKLLQQKNKLYDVIVVDPPAFVKRAKDFKEGIVAYQRINELALKLLKPSGILISCSCSMHVSIDDLIQVLSRAAYRVPCQLQMLERHHQGPDHPIHMHIPETDYLKTIIVRKLAV